MKKLTRSQEKAVVAGVLAGLAKYFDHDPVLYRVIAITFLIITGFFPGILMYLAAWIIMPKTPVSTDYEVVE
ncbi:hypothetical protein CL638_01765 [bacterium]|nr:hypothetical protein [bacterium]|tara:strand:- start:261 stop:476 length:216 start_codon:yes stop_codon:yes gene_type:complete